MLYALGLDAVAGASPDDWRQGDEGRAEFEQTRRTARSSPAAIQPERKRPWTGGNGRSSIAVAIARDSVAGLSYCSPPLRLRSPWPQIPQLDQLDLLIHFPYVFPTLVSQ